jgi:hypothetical protein
MPQGSLASGVDVLDGGDIGLVETDRLVYENTKDAVGDEAGDLLVEDHGLLLSSALLLSGAVKLSLLMCCALWSTDRHPDAARASTVLACFVFVAAAPATYWTEIFTRVLCVRLGLIAGDHPLAAFLIALTHFFLLRFFPSSSHTRAEVGKTPLSRRTHVFRFLRE